MKLTEEIFKWQGFGNGQGLWTSRCVLEIYANNNKVIAIASEVDNPGTSITNCAENLATLVLRHIMGFPEGHKVNSNSFLPVRPENFVWIEHYPSGKKQNETFDLVQLTWDGSRFHSPKWKRLPLETVERMTGENLAP